MIDPSEQLVQEDFPEATVIRIRVRKLSGDEQSTAIEAALFQFVETGKGRLILDFTAVEYLGSAAIGILITLRRRLMAGGKTFQPPCRRRGLFAFFRDEAEAVEAIRRGETDPLLLCGISPQIMEVFQVC
jgi:hypothetical protein